MKQPEITSKLTVSKSDNKILNIKLHDIKKNAIHKRDKIFDQAKEICTWKRHTHEILLIQEWLWITNQR
jgi:hypothetical protein